MTQQLVELVKVPIEHGAVREVDFNGMKLRGVLGPLDTPDRAELRISEDKKWFTVSFAYPLSSSEEVNVQKDQKSGVRLEIGKDSGRIFRIRAPLPEGAMGQITFSAIVHEVEELERATQDLPFNDQPPRRLAHYDMVKTMLPWMGSAIDRLRRQQGVRGNLSRNQKRRLRQDLQR